MALDADKLKHDIKVALKGIIDSPPGSTTNETLEAISQALATAIDAYVRSAEVPSDGGSLS